MLSTFEILNIEQIFGFRDVIFQIFMHFYFNIQETFIVSSILE